MNGWATGDGPVLINQELDYNSCEALHLQGKTDSQKNLKNLSVKRPIFSVVYEAKDMKFCTHGPRTCVQKRSVLDIYLFA